MLFRLRRCQVMFASLFFANICNKAGIFNMFLVYMRSKWGSSRETLSSGYPTKHVSNQASQLHRLARKLKFHLQQVYIQRITKALIRLRGCAGWSAPALFANPRRQVFSR